MYIYAHINKETLRFIREKKAVSFNYINRVAKLMEAKVLLWEDADSGKFPTINQAKAIAKCYRIPFAGLYMNSRDINIKHLPQMRNLRTLPEATVDNSSLNLAIADVLSARDLLIESKTALREPIQPFCFTMIGMEENIAKWANSIRKILALDINAQYRCQSTRQFYLYLRNKVEFAGAFVHSFTGIDPEIVRGFAIYYDELPIIGINNEDRYPAKSFTIIHELVHLIKRSSAVCNEMLTSFSSQAEEVFCNAVAGETLVPRMELIGQLKDSSTCEMDLNTLDLLAKKFSVSREVVCRRLFDIGKITHQKYIEASSEIHKSFEKEKEALRNSRKLAGVGIARNISREAIDQTSTTLCRTFYHGYRDGFFDKQDISRYLGIKQNHIDKFLWELSRW